MSDRGRNSRQTRVAGSRVSDLPGNYQRLTRAAGLWLVEAHVLLRAINLPAFKPLGPNRGVRRVSSKAVVAPSERLYAAVQNRAVHLIMVMMIYFPKSGVELLLTVPTICEGMTSVTMPVEIP